ncbi:MAG TPA: alpha/beta fold hydrolase [Thermoleophilaceae bacterium]|nr:alpha/beta fold hydrolase [Thermoleophilaceae bacterium]
MIPLVRRGLIAVAVLAGLLVLPPAAGAALRFEDCDRGAFRCARVTVPLDYSGAVKGKVGLRVLRAPATGRRRGVVVLLAGGPGQSAVSAYADNSLGPLGPIRRTHDVLVFDQRGSGGSGLLRCRPLERANILRAGRQAAQCAAKLGPRRAFYTSRDTADDIETLRRRLAVPKLSLYGVSYGTRTATAYALRYPARVQRLGLDSVVAPDGADALAVDTFRAVPRVLRALCGARRCRSFTRDPVADLATLVQRMAAGGPLRGTLPDARGRPRRAALSRYDLFGAFVSGDFEAEMRSGYPAAVKAALAGDPAPLLRLKRRSIAIESGGFEPEELSSALYAATTCEEARLPWPRSTPFAQRRARSVAAAATLAPTLIAPFDAATVLGSDVLDLCSLWPQSARDPSPGRGPLPDVPALLVEGADDVRTPLETARTLAQSLPRARVVTVAGAGHSPGSGLSRCATGLAARFFAGRSVPRACRDARSPRPTSLPPRSLKGVKPLAAVSQTLEDVVGDVAFAGEDGRGVGLRRGRYSLDDDLRLSGFSYVPGLRLTGLIKRFDSDRRRRGSIRVSGPRGYRGALRFRGRRVSGRLGGRRVTARVVLAASVPRAGSAARAERPGHE